MAHWIQDVKGRGLDDALRAALTVLEPLGAVGASALWVAQPLLTPFVPAEALREVAEALETPGGVARLRALLDDDTHT